MMIRKILALLLIALSIHSFGQVTDSLIQKPKLLPSWTFLVPGSSFFYQGKIIQGSIFSTLEIGGVYLGIKYDKTLKNNSSSPYYNYPLLIGLQAFQTEKLAGFKNQLEFFKYYRPDFKYDDLSDKDLYLAPFKIRNIITPITGGMVLLATAFLGIEKYNETNRFRDIDKMYFLNRYIDRNQGLAVFGTTSLAISWSAGVSEEYVFRNWMMPLLDYKYGQKKGLIISSAVFGGMHFSNLLFADKPDYKSALIQVGEATIAGYFLGRDVQKRGYDIGPAVAAHMWYDFTLMLGSFLINPKNNFLGVNLKFKI
ncbi:MAG TPA: CPBP family intramembrane metalloprotease [Prolixibacteraceae bacterium]|jgi:membrane protease YdiL (CAAX protease family)|nr:CPBP family intramembrane metalloprotease [Prolixibacteraceae bacterium]HOC85743.1 CPBP family intramembrane metalloprotease [Prolixibacteraceae bacterium]HOG95189.1 CPBP family intramembrane metalloprotease [Prolixibacteraceae bacterium]HOY91893.1 CPBP family intramembrane metalloprotease [Prolixibacteraceae bacterium]HPN75692.1 CPBP family intramembrane metalloprotease [Prolixibacteraceae bacterium]